MERQRDRQDSLCWCIGFWVEARGEEVKTALMTCLVGGMCLEPRQ